VSSGVFSQMFQLRSHLLRFFSVIAILLLGLVVALNSFDPIRWRFTLVRMKALGRLQDVGWKDLFWMSRPGSHFNLRDLSKIPSPYATIKSPYGSPSDIQAGSALFQSGCAICHGAGGAGGPTGPNLRHRQMVQGSSDWALFRTITYGIRGTSMAGVELSPRDKWLLVAYVKSLTHGQESTTNSMHSPAIPNLDPIRYDEILDPHHSSEGWLTYSGSYDSQRHSSLNKITGKNVRGLRLLWMKQYNTSEPSIETSPLVSGGYMFVTVPPNRVEALNASTGDLIWSYDRELPDNLSLCCGYVNRGLAVLGNTLFLGTLDAHLVALDSRTGQQIWDEEIADHAAGYSITGAPLAFKNLVVTGVAGGEFGIRGFVEACDATTGKEVWKFNTIPESGQSGADSWNRLALNTGGGPTWLTGSFDAANNLLYWPTGNPSPNFEGEVRAGDNLYTNSVVALDADHGTLKWAFQFTPHDVFDWDATEILVLFDRKVSGTQQHLLAQANRNGFFYLLDRDTGAFRLGRSFAKQTWAENIDAHGRPIVIPAAHPTEKGTSVFPGVGGATNWQSPSYSPSTGLFYVSVLDWGGIFYARHAEYHKGQTFTGGSFEFDEPALSEAAVRALDPMTGEVKWEFRNPATNVGGLLSTEGGLVFGSQDRSFFALDAETGHELWQVSTGGRIVAAPITFSIKGRQFVTIAAGHDILTFGVE
jgi:alcohol dehydrogenase (cytochrome c)